MFSGDTAGAAADFQAAVELKPGALGAWEGIAQLKAATGEMAEAAETYQKLVRAIIGPLAAAGTLLASLRALLPADAGTVLGRMHIGLAHARHNGQV